MANINTPDSKPSLVSVPSNYPMEPTPGKISILFAANSDKLYHKFNPQNYDNGNGFGFTQPYIYRYPGDAPSEFLQTTEIGSRTDDLVRVTKYVASGRGVLFVAKQFLLQGYQPFDETNIYNPTEVILSATSNLTYGILPPPTRHLDTSGGLLGGLAGLVGLQVSRAQPPPSTVAAGDGSGGSQSGGLFSNFSLLGNTGGNRETEVLPVQNYGEGAGLLRAKDALKARSILQVKWGAATDGGSGGGILGFVTGLAKSMFPQVFGADKQNFQQRADEQAYDWMLKYYNDNTANNLVQGIKSDGLSISFLGINLKSPNVSRISNQISKTATSLFQQRYYNKSYNGSYIYNKDQVFVEGDNEQSDILKIYNNSYNIQDSEGIESQRNQYFDVRSWSSVEGQSPVENAYDSYTSEGDLVKSSDLVEESAYNQNYEGDQSEFSVPFDNTNGKIANNRSVSQNTKLNDACSDDVVKINENLQKVIRNIGKSGIYKTNITNDDNWLLQSGNSSKQGYDRLHDMSSTDILRNNPDSVESTYNDNDVRTLDSIVNPNKNFGFAGNNRPDKINTLTILDDDQKVKENLLTNYTEWNPYKDDLIAFFFYDIVNHKYIPFRATVKSISESNNALWDELRFMGRADALYSYTGFTRNLSFVFTVVVNSLVELWPIWKRINYLSSAIKPAGYTQKTQNDNVVNRFVIPPMFTVTIGDLYKYQPIVISSVTMNVPEGSSWELVPETSTEDWSHMANMIQSSVPKERIGQMPREIDISVACNLLEKERPRVGGNHYGHSPEDEKGFQLVGTNDQPFLPVIEDFSQNLREYKSQNFEG